MRLCGGGGAAPSLIRSRCSSHSLVKKISRSGCRQFLRPPSYNPMTLFSSALRPHLRRPLASLSLGSAPPPVSQRSSHTLRRAAPAACSLLPAPPPLPSKPSPHILLSSRSLQLASKPPAMAPQTQNLEDLTALLKGFGLSDVPQGPNTYPERNPFDLYRTHIAELVSSVLPEAKKDVVQGALQWTTTLDRGDLILPVPALRLPKGTKPADVATKIADAVSIPTI